MENYEFDAVKERDRLVEALRELALQQGFSRVVLGISGGKDSSVSAALCARALGMRHRTLNIGAMHRALLAQVEPEQGPEAGEFAIPFDRESNINVGPRLRMTLLRYAAQALGARLVGTGNLSEATVGYCTKDGDTSCDFSLLGSLTSVEVVEVGLTMEELPRDLVVKTPSDGLSGMSDEEKLGLRYRDIHNYLRLGTSGDPETDEKIRRKEAVNLHKRRMPIVL